MDIGQKIDALYATRAQRLEIEKQVNALKAQETATKAEIIEQLKSLSLEGAKGSAATAAITYKVKPSVTDWDAVYKYIADNNMFELLHKAITVSLWTALQDDGIVVPGTEPMPIVDLSLTKR
jgi:hypothetical protein